MRHDTPRSVRPAVASLERPRPFFGCVTVFRSRTTNSPAFSSRSSACSADGPCLAIRCSETSWRARHAGGTPARLIRCATPGRERRSGRRGDDGGAPRRDSLRGRHAARPRARNPGRGRGRVDDRRSDAPACRCPGSPAILRSHARPRDHHADGVDDHHADSLCDRRVGPRYGRNRGHACGSGCRGATGNSWSSFDLLVRPHMGTMFNGARLHAPGRFEPTSGHGRQQGRRRHAWRRDGASRDAPRGGTSVVPRRSSASLLLAPPTPTRIVLRAQAERQCVSVLDRPARATSPPRRPNHRAAAHEPAHARGVRRGRELEAKNPFSIYHSID